MAEVAPHVQDDFDIQVGGWWVRVQCAVCRGGGCRGRWDPSYALPLLLLQHHTASQRIGFPPLPVLKLHRLGQLLAGKARVACAPLRPTAHLQEEGMAELVELAERPEVQEKLRRRIQSCDVKVWVGGGPAWKDRRTRSTALHCTAHSSSLAGALLCPRHLDIQGTLQACCC